MRTSLLISCSAAEAQQVRTRAKLEQRAVSAYVVHVVVPGIVFAEQIGLFRYGSKKKKPVHPRATLHIYCSAQDANRIRSAARKAGTTISGLVLYFLWHSWGAQDKVRKPRD